MIKKEQGFTLIELLIVIIILGILAVVGIPKFMDSKATAEANTCKTNRATLEDAQERYKFNESNYATSQTQLKDGDYIKREFVCPKAGTYTLEDDGSVTCDEHADASPSASP